MEELKKDIRRQVNEKANTFKKHNIGYVDGYLNLHKVQNKVDEVINYFHQENYEIAYAHVGGLLSELSVHFVNSQKNSKVNESEYWTFFMENMSLLSLIYAKSILRLDIKSRDLIYKAMKNALLAPKLTGHIDKNFVMECEMVYQQSKSIINEKVDHSKDLYEFFKSSTFENRIRALSISIESGNTPCPIYNNEIKFSS